MSVFRKSFDYVAYARKPWIGTKSAANVTVTPGTATLTLATYAPTVRTPRLVTPGTKALVLTDYAPVARTPRLVTPGTATLVLTGYAPLLTTPNLVTPIPATLVLTGTAPDVFVTVSRPAVIIIGPRKQRRARIDARLGRLEARGAPHAKRRGQVDDIIGSFAADVRAFVRRPAAISGAVGAVASVQAAAAFAPRIQQSIYTRASVTAIRFDRNVEDFELLGWSDDEEAMLLGIGERT